MAFTPVYDDDQILDVDIVRFYIGDTIQNDGPRPSKSNYSTAEISATLTRLSGDVNAAIVAFYGVLAGEYSKFARSEEGVKHKFNAEKTSGEMREAAKWYKANPIDGSSGGLVFRSTGPGG